jgi:hypothetical protein
MPINNKEMDTEYEKLIKEVIKYVAKQNGVPQRNYGGVTWSVENKPSTEVPGFETFEEQWNKAVADREECQQYKDFKFDVDLFVMSPETPRSHTAHFHPMPLITNHLPIKQEWSYYETHLNAGQGEQKVLKDDITGRAFIISNEGKFIVPDRTFLPLAAGTLHHENEDNNNRIFVVLSPKTRKLNEFRANRTNLIKKYQEKQAKKDIIKDQDYWWKLDTVDNTVSCETMPMCSQQSVSVDCPDKLQEMQKLGVLAKVDNNGPITTFLSSQDKDNKELFGESFEFSEWGEVCTDVKVEDAWKDLLKNLENKFLQDMVKPEEPVLDEV